MQSGTGRCLGRYVVRCVADVGSHIVGLQSGVGRCVGRQTYEKHKMIK